MAGAFVELADTLVGDFDVISILHALVEHCVGLLDVAAAGVLLTTAQGGVVEAAASDERTRGLELASVVWDQGPCRDCCRTGDPVCDVQLDTAGARRRWPQFTPPVRWNWGSPR